jgi:hypothetical protein
MSSETKRSHNLVNMIHMSNEKQPRTTQAFNERSENENPSNREVVNCPI